MKQLLFSVVCILVFSFCQNKTIIVFEKDSVFKLSEHYSKFKFHDLKEFKIDFGYEEMDKDYRKLDSLEINQVIQGDSDLLKSRLFYYSTFADSSLIALIGDSNDENGLIMWLLKYNGNGKLQGKKAIAASWGDAGDAWHSYGKMVKSNVFICTDVSSSMIGDDIETSDIEIDSTIIKINFQTNKIKIDTILSKRDTIQQDRSN